MGVFGLILSFLKVGSKLR
ncbi:hypothetical protein OK016_02845 [Vibrio chagasii]|nr:hypothetical protein [Vibrio chagasii]